MGCLYASLLFWVLGGNAELKADWTKPIFLNDGAGKKVGNKTD